DGRRTGPLYLERDGAPVAVVLSTAEFRPEAPALPEVSPEQNRAFIHALMELGEELHDLDISRPTAVPREDPFENWTEENAATEKSLVRFLMEMPMQGVELTRPPAVPRKDPFDE